MHLVLLHQDRFLGEVTEVWEALEKSLNASCIKTARAAELLLDNGEEALAGDVLTYFSKTELLAALDLAEKLLASIEARARLLHGVRAEETPRSADQIW